MYDPTGNGALLRTLSETSLRRLRSLTDGLVDRVWEDVYVPLGPVAKDDLWRSCHANLGGILHALDHPRGSSPVLAGPARSTGERRARQNCPLEWVQHAWRVGGQVIWEDFSRQVGLEDADELRGLVESATSVWTVVEESSAVMVTTYRSVEHELREPPDHRADELMDALLDGRTPEDPGEVARVLGLPRDDGFVVMVTDRLPDGGLRRLADLLRADGLPTVWRRRNGLYVGIAAGVEPDVAAAGLARVPAGRVGVSPVVAGPAEVAAGRRLAELALNTLPQGRAKVVTLDECLPDALLISSPQLAQRLIDVTVGPLLTLRAFERDELLDTAGAWIRSAGSAVQAARSLYCHRNTVLNRLSRIQRLAGLDLTDTSQWPQVSLALSALRHLRATGQAPPAREASSELGASG